MKKTLMTLFLLSACSLMLAAQSQNQSQTDQWNTPSSSQMKKDVTLTGCLRPGKDPNTYILSGVTPGEMNEQSSREQSNNSQAEDRGDNELSRGQDQSRSDSIPSEMARTENNYTLIPEGKVDLRSHLGHRVEVTGKIIESSSRTNQMSESSEQSSNSHGSTEMSGQPQLRVSSIRHIADSCQ